LRNTDLPDAEWQGIADVKLANVFASARTAWVFGMGYEEGGSFR
jgi:hypothetical protein